MPQLLIFGCRFDCGKEEKKLGKSEKKKKKGRRNERVKKQRS